MIKLIQKFPIYYEYNAHSFDQLKYLAKRRNFAVKQFDTIIGVSPTFVSKYGIYTPNEY